MRKTRFGETSGPVSLVHLCSSSQKQTTSKHRVLHQRSVRQNCYSGADRNKGVQIQPSLTHELRRHAPALPSNGTSQQERFLAFENTPAELHDDDHDHHRHPDNDSTVHKVLAWIFTRVGLLPLAAQLRGKAWNAITIAGLMAVALLTAWAGGTQAASAHVCRQISTAATAAIYFLAGIPELIDLCFDLTAGHIDTHVLMTLAVFGTLAIGGALEGALLMVLFEGSHVLEHKLTGEAQGNLQALFDATPEYATLVDLNSDSSPDMTRLHKAKAREVAVGSNMLIRPGEQVPLDGVVVHGTAQVSWSHISGEALPVQLQQGGEVPAGTLNHDGLLVVQASKGFQDSTPARIARLTAQAQASRPKMKRWIDSFGEVYSKAIIAATLVIIIVLPLLGVPMLGSATQRGAFYRAMGFLTTASPCALVLVPLAYVSAIGAVTNSGILIQGGNVLDALVKCTTIAFDKTGTLTTGSLTCTSMLPVHPSTDNPSPSQAPKGDVDWVQALTQQGGSEGLTALAQAAALSVRGTHPVSQAVLACAKSAGASLPQLQDFHQQPGAGVQGTTQRSGKKRRIRFGSQAFVSQSLTSSQQDALRQACREQGSDRVISVLVDSAADSETTSRSGSQQPSSSQQGSSAESSMHSSSRSMASDPHNHSSQQSSGSDSQMWVFAFQDTVHEHSAATLHSLRQGSWLGRGRKQKRLSVMMLTGDNEASAQRVAKQLNIEDVRAGLSPEQKLQAVDEARRSSNHKAGGGVMMVGDGINDAPALAAADVGIAISDNPTAAAAAAADIIVLSKEGVASIPLLLHLAHRTQRVLRQNLILAIGSILVLALPVVLGFLPLWVAVSFHEGSTLLVALNSLKLLQWRQQASASQGTASVASVQT
ncbi:putative cadmium/zinc-transporting ATPase hma1, chloroplastic [Trebouxia sp. C0009 RCD-2024]